MNKKRVVFIVILLLIIAFCLFFIKQNSHFQIQEVSASIDNTKIEWGIKRAKNHEQPDLGGNKKLIDENQDIAMGNAEDKYVYLTFDLGYEAGYTPKILDVLKQNNVKAAFFITGHYLNSAKDLVKQMIDEGHIVGNHTVNHYSMPEIDEEKLKEEITNLHTAVYESFGYEMKYFRPPKGEFSQKTLALTKNLGYTTVMWSFAYDDWDEKKQGRENYAKEKILSNIHNGCVILLHGNSIDNCNILDGVITKIQKMGYSFKSLDEFKP